MGRNRIGKGEGRKRVQVKVKENSGENEKEDHGSLGWGQENDGIG